ncbi:hypothetical protein AZE42_08736, partial [Rhizopogon vesiculosus]
LAGPPNILGRKYCEHHQWQRRAVRDFSEEEPGRIHVRLETPLIMGWYAALPMAKITLRYALAVCWTGRGSRFKFCRSLSKVKMKMTAARAGFSAPFENRKASSISYLLTDPNATPILVQYINASGRLKTTFGEVPLPHKPPD